MQKSMQKSMPEMFGGNVNMQREGAKSVYLSDGSESDGSGSDGAGCDGTGNV